jgi:hypothetical protein
MKVSDMRLVHYSFALLLCALSMVRALRAQERPVSLAAGGGLLFVDKSSSTIVGSRGITAFFRLSWRRFPLILDASVQNVPRNRDIIFGPCPPPSAGACGSSPFIGPITAFTLAPAIQATQRVPVAAWLFRLGPSVSWLSGREPGSHPLAAGIRAGISVRNGRAQSGLLISADYFRLFRAGTPPKWFLPVTIGWQF